MFLIATVFISFFLGAYCLTFVWRHWHDLFGYFCAILWGLFWIWPIAFLIRILKFDCYSNSFNISSLLFSVGILCVIISVVETLLDEGDLSTKMAYFLMFMGIFIVFVSLIIADLLPFYVILPFIFVLLVICVHIVYAFIKQSKSKFLFVSIRVCNTKMHFLTQVQWFLKKAPVWKNYRNYDCYDMKDVTKSLIHESINALEPGVYFCETHQFLLRLMKEHNNVKIIKQYGLYLHDGREKRLRKNMPKAMCEKHDNCPIQDKICVGKIGDYRLIKFQVE